jgi:hypothetical protein
MARRLAARWLQDRVHPEFRLKVFTVGTSREKKALPSLLRSFRDDKVKLGSIDPLPDLGVKEGFDHFVVWSSHREALLKLGSWLEERGYETSGIW